jgi:hypothetical protein
MAMDTAGADPRWNLFARTLEDLLRAHDTPLSQLDNLRERPGEELDAQDLNRERELVHREKLRRLSISLREPGTFPALNRDDIERIARYFDFNDGERRKLSAAMLATYIQRLVYERISDKRDEEKKRRAAALALGIVESMLPALEAALRELGDEGLDAFRVAGAEAAVSAKGGMDTMEMGAMIPQIPGDPGGAQPDERRVYAALASALDAVDRATVALQLSYTAAESFERLEALDEQETAVRASPVWRVWHDEARRGFDEANERVIDLGG